MRIDWDEQSIRIRKLKKAMNYGPEDYAKDYQAALAMAEIMAVYGETEERHYLLAHYMMNVQAYLANNPDARPFDV